MDKLTPKNPSDPGKVQRNNLNEEPSGDPSSHASASDNPDDGKNINSFPRASSAQSQASVRSNQAQPLTISIANTSSNFVPFNDPRFETRTKQQLQEVHDYFKVLVLKQREFNNWSWSLSFSNPSSTKGPNLDQTIKSCLDNTPHGVSYQRLPNMFSSAQPIPESKDNQGPTTFYPSAPDLIIPNSKPQIPTPTKQFLLSLKDAGIAEMDNAGLKVVLSSALDYLSLLNNDIKLLRSNHKKEMHALDVTTKQLKSEISTLKFCAKTDENEMRIKLSEEKLKDKEIEMLRTKFLSTRKELDRIKTSSRLKHPSVSKAPAPYSRLSHKTDPNLMDRASTLIDESTLSNFANSITSFGKTPTDNLTRPSLGIVRHHDTTIEVPEPDFVHYPAIQSGRESPRRRESFAQPAITSYSSPGIRRDTFNAYQGIEMPNPRHRLSPILNTNRKLPRTNNNVSFNTQGFDESRDYTSQNDDFSFTESTFRNFGPHIRLDHNQIPPNTYLNRADSVEPPPIWPAPQQDCVEAPQGSEFSIDRSIVGNLPRLEPRPILSSTSNRRSSDTIAFVPPKDKGVHPFKTNLNHQLSLAQNGPRLISRDNSNQLISSSHSFRAPSVNEATSSRKDSGSSTTSGSQPDPMFSRPTLTADELAGARRYHRPIQPRPIAPKATSREGVYLAPKPVTKLVRTGVVSDGSPSPFSSPSLEPGTAHIQNLDSIDGQLDLNQDDSEAETESMDPFYSQEGNDFPKERSIAHRNVPILTRGASGLTRDASLLGGDPSQLTRSDSVLFRNATHIAMDEVSLTKNESDIPRSDSAIDRREPLASSMSTGYTKFKPILPMPNQALPEPAKPFVKKSRAKLRPAPKVGTPTELIAKGFGQLWPTLESNNSQATGFPRSLTAPNITQQDLTESRRIHSSLQASQNFEFNQPPLVQILPRPNSNIQQAQHSNPQPLPIKPSPSTPLAQQLTYSNRTLNANDTHPTKQ